jgi:hypothetical protein
MSYALPAAVLLLIGALFFLAHRRGVLLAVASAVFLGACLASGLAYWAAATDYQDADGFIDCWPSCTAIQDATGWGVVLAPIVVLVAGAAIALALITRHGSTRSQQS